MRGHSRQSSLTSSDANGFLQSKSKLHMPQLQWPRALKIKIPDRFQRRSLRSGSRSRKLRSRRQHQYDEPTDITRMQKSFNPWDGVRAIQRHRWGWLDIQYPALAGFMLFSLAIAPMPVLVKIGIPIWAVLVCLMPATRQFFLPSMPIWTYLLYFFCSRFIPVQYRPHIWVKVLPALENVLYGTNISSLLSAHTHPILDLLAWFPYGVGHFGGPAVVSLALFFFAAPSTTPVFARSFGWLALTGVTLSLVFPCTPPWYEAEHGLEPARYGMPGSPAGLARIDKLFGIDMYTTSFTTAPMPFGAFPSLHSANATLEALFMSFAFPRLRPLFVFYVGWLWWATMYLNHHYAVDLVGGALLSVGIYLFARARYLPRPQPDKRNRWAYDFIEVGATPALDEEYGLLGGGGKLQHEERYGLRSLRRSGSFSAGDSWSLGSSSAFSSPRTSTTSPTLMSPMTPDGSMREQVNVAIPMGLDGRLVWDERGGEAELNEVVVVR